MELRDYLQMLRRGIATVVIMTVLGLAGGALYLALAPRVYGAATSLYVSTSDPISITDLQQGSNFASNAVITYAQIIDSTTILAPVAASLRPQKSPEALVGSVQSSVRENTTLIDIAVTGGDPREVAIIANSTAEVATRLLPTLQTGPDGRPLVKVQQLRPAVEPSGPDSPSVARMLTIGLVVGLAGGLAITIVRQSLDTRVRRGDEIAGLSGVPLLASVPAIRAGLSTRSVPEPVVVSRADSAAAEAYRLLSTNLLSTGRLQRSLLCAAVADDDSSARLAVNLAWNVALAGLRVLLIDLDIRHARAGGLLGIDAGEGLTDILSRGGDAAEVAELSEDARFRYLGPGTRRETLASVLTTSGASSLMSRLERENDLVIISSCGLSTYAEASAAVRLVSATIVTLRAGSTTSAELSNALRQVNYLRVRPLGTVLLDRREKEKAVAVKDDDAGEKFSALDEPTIMQRPGDRGRLNNGYRGYKSSGWPREGSSRQGSTELG